MAGFLLNRQAGQIFGIRLSALFETLIFLIGVCLLNYLFGSGTRFIDTCYHPFWIIILLVTVQYGTVEGLIAVILSTLFLYVGNVPKQLPDEDYFAYQLRLGLLPALWFITAFILGELRMRIEWEKEQLLGELLHTKSQVEKITSEYQTLKESNRNLELHLAGEEDTVTSAFKVFKALESLEPAQVIFGLDPIIETALHPNKFSVFANGPNGLEAVTSEGWGQNDRYHRRFLPSSPIFQAIIQGKRMIALVNKEDRSILESEGVVAAPLIDLKTGEVFGMIKIEDIDLSYLSLSRLQTFKIVCELVGSAYANAKKHHMAKKTAMYSALPNVYSAALFHFTADFLRKISFQEKKSLELLKINFLKGKEMDDAGLKLLQTSLPKEIQFFEGEKKQIFILVIPSKINKGEMKMIIENELVQAGFSRNDLIIEEEKLDLYTQTT